MKVVIIIPTYNEKGNIERIVPITEDVFKRINNYEMEILVTDDNSPDGTAEKVIELSKKYKNIELSSGMRHGLGAAYVRGMTYAIEKMGADIVFEMDADLQHDPEKIPNFLAKIDEGNDMVIGTRYSEGGSIPAAWPIHRKIFSIFGNLLIRTIMMRFWLHDWTGGFRALKKEVFLKEKDELTEFKGYTFQVSFLHKAVRDGFKIAEVPFHFGERNIGDSKIAPMSYIANVLKYVITARIKELVFGKFGKFMVVGGFGFVINAVVLRALVEGFNFAPVPANLIGAACAIFSNFNFNNLWTFGERKANTVISYFSKLIQFYATSAFGVIFIQTGTIFLGDTFIGRQYYFIYFLVGTGVLLTWNFTMYSVVIWRKSRR
ncbi:MAG: glycosyltransferase [Candidatus Levybacteria bacterium]|nr:glycosyltransferase [Candidatus Levybacteria bacterium]